MSGQLLAHPAHRVVVLREEDAAPVHPAFGCIGVGAEQVAEDGFQLRVAFAAFFQKPEAALQGRDLVCGEVAELAVALGLPLVTEEVFVNVVLAFAVACVWRDLNQFRYTPWAPRN